MADVSMRQHKRSAAKILRKYKRQKRHGLIPPFVTVIVTAAVIVLTVGCGFAFVIDEVTVSKKEAELAELNEKIEMLRAENEQYESILSDDDERSFMERIAEERLGYAYPNEKRFVDPNKNNG
ncbi:MAG: septum formation initiator family protein [Oscillospiraceae bacterium]|nr:septum formation initiator family protein [Oscillospiraceae bacterium]MBQ8979261.1 septum formation initiator family protein [Oscillospiraceae bacterium]